MSSGTLAPYQGAGAGWASSPGIVTRLVERADVEQTRRAKDAVFRFLAGYSDGRLSELGFSPDEIAQIRGTGGSSSATCG